MSIDRRGVFFLAATVCKDRCGKFEHRSTWCSSLRSPLFVKIDVDNLSIDRRGVLPCGHRLYRRWDLTAYSAGGHSTLPGLCPTKLPVMWETGADLLGVPAMVPSLWSASRHIMLSFWSASQQKMLSFWSADLHNHF